MKFSSRGNCVTEPKHLKLLAGLLWFASRDISLGETNGLVMVEIARLCCVHKEFRNEDMIFNKQRSENIALDRLLCEEIGRFR